MKIIITRIFMSITIILSLVGRISGSQLTSDEKELIKLSAQERGQRWQGSSMESFERLLKKGTNPNIRGSFERSPLYHACTNGNHRAIELLLKYNVDTEMLYPRNGENLTLLQILLSDPSFTKYPEEIFVVVGELLRHDANPNVVNKNGDAPLFFAARWNYRNADAIVRDLIYAGADVNHQNKNGNTALHEAVRLDRYLVVQILVTEGHAKTTIENNKGKSPTDMAIEAGNNSLLRYLLPHPPIKR